MALQQMIQSESVLGMGKLEVCIGVWVSQTMKIHQPSHLMNHTMRSTLPPNKKQMLSVAVFRQLVLSALNPWFLSGKDERQGLFQGCFSISERTPRGQARQYGDLLPCDLHDSLRPAATSQKPVWCYAQSFRLKPGRPRLESHSSIEAYLVTLGQSHVDDIFLRIAVLTFCLF